MTSNEAEHHLRWPKEGDIPFVTGTTSSGTPVQTDAKNRHAYMVAGYQRAAEHLIEKASGNWSEDEGLLYPIVFMYRHLVELSLKELISEFGARVGVEPDRKSHGLQTLWSKFMDVQTKLDIEQDDSTTASVAQIIKELDSVDPGSFSFRYAADRKGELLDLRHKAIDLFVLAEVMEGLINYLNATYAYESGGAKLVHGSGGIVLLRAA